MLHSISLFVFLIVLLLNKVEIADASHFTYGTFIWKRTSINTDNTATYTVTFEQGWRLDAFCTLASPEINCMGRSAGEGSVTFTPSVTMTGVSSTSKTAAGPIVAVFKDSNWCVARSQIVVTLSLKTDWKIGYSMCCRIGGIQDGNTNSVGIYAFIKSGEAEGVGISSAPRYFFQKGIPISFTVPAVSSQGYALTYAFTPLADSQLSKAFPLGMTLNPTNGVVTWTPPVLTVATSYMYAVSFKITDSKGQYTMLDVIFQTLASCTTSTCNSPPAFTAPITPYDFSANGKQGYYFYPGVAKSFTIAANDPNTANTVTIKNGPMPTSATFVQTVTGNPTQYKFTWTPAMSDPSSVVCFIAYDNLQLMSLNQYCIDVVMGPSVTTAVVTTFNAPTGPTSGGSTITISGYRFTTTAGTVKINNNNCAVITWTDTSITCTTPVGQGTNLPILVTNGAGASDPSTSPKFSYQPPTITPMAINIPSAGGAVTLSGTNFGTLATASVSGSSTAISASVSSQTHTSMIVNIGAGSGTGLTLTIDVSGQKATIQFSYQSSGITSITPSVIPTSGSIITISGSGFTSAATVAVSNGNPNPSISITSTTATQILVSVGPGTGLNLQLTLTQGTSTSSKTFSYAAPTISSFTPSQIPTTGSQIVIAGSNFGTSNNAVVSISGVTPLPTVSKVSQTDSSITVNVGPGQGAQIVITITVNGQIVSRVYGYIAPVITSQTPSSISPSGGLLTLVGTNFGISATVIVSGVTPLPVVSVSSTTHTQVIVNIGSGIGKGITLTLNVGGQTTTTTFSYTGPTITSILPAIIPTTGTTITLIGTNLGGVSSISVTNGSPNPTIAIASGSTSTQVVATLGAGAGKNLQIFVTSGGQVTSYNFTFAAPTITSTTPTILPTNGGSITITGTNFGPSASVSLSTTGTGITPSFTPTALSHTQIVLSIGSGSGTPYTISINAGGQIVSTSFSFGVPSVTSISPVLLPTVGGQVIVTGVNFGTSLAAVNLAITGGSGGVTPTVSATSVTHTSVTITVGAGTGKNYALKITIGGQQTTTTLSFAPPTISTVSNYIYSGSTLIISGTNYGGSLGSATVSVTGGTSNPTITITAQTHTQITATVGSGFGSGLTLTVSVGGQMVSTKISMTPWLFTRANYANVPTTGGFSVTFTGANLCDPSTTTTLNIKYGKVVTPNAFSDKAFTCTSAAITAAACTPAALASLTVTCTTSVSVGIGLVFQVQVGTSTTLDSTWTLTHVAPTITSTSLRAALGDSGVSALYSNSPTGDLLYFNVANVGDATMLPYITAFYSDVSPCVDISNTNPCSDVAFYNGAATISCRTNVGSSGKPFRFQIKALGQSSACSLDTYLPPSVPAISSVTVASGCTQSGNEIISCPTKGNVVVTINGINFMPTNTSVVYANIGNKRCSQKSYTNTTFICTLPSGTGFKNMVSIVADGKSSVGVPYVSYSSPTITSISGCPTSNVTITELCSRSIDTTITLTGDNFGEANAVVLVNGVPCSNVTHDSNFPHNSLTCTIPKLSGLSLPVYLTQDCGTKSNSVQLSYEPCLEGTTENPGSTMCTPCDIGKYTSLKSSYSCVPCPSGTFANTTGASVCTSCDVGTFSSISGASQCTPCPDGQYTSLAGSSKCLACPSGSYSNSVTGYVQCVDCSTGKYASSQNGLFGATSCVSCANYQYQDQTGTASCKTCTAGFIGATQTDASSCVPCSVGQYGEVSSNQAVCKECPLGKASSQAGSTSCSACEPGTISNTTSQVSCYKCDVGTYSKDIGGMSCTACEDGYYADQIGSSTCKSCPVGKISAVSSGAVSCVDCPIGQYGTLDTVTRKLICSVCPNGQYQDTVGRTSCKSCPSGSISNSTGSVSCISCDIGKHSDSSMTSCVDCESGKYQGDMGQSECKSCVAGTYSEFFTGSIKCLPCSAGYYGAIGSNQVAACIACTLGKYNPMPGATSCDTCPRGSISNTTALGQCIVCPEGTHSDLMGTSCVDCELGKFAAVSGRSSCDDCDDGYYANWTSAKQCNKCPPGYISSTPAHKQMGCLSCSEGSYQPAYAQSACLDCDLGLFSNFKAATSCMKCPITTYQERSGASSCDDCQMGKYTVSEGASYCFVCSVGYFNNATKQSSCYGCVPGQYQDDIAQTSCIDCEVGKYSSSYQNKYCYECNPGTYINQTGVSACNKCEVGRYTPFYGNLSCAECAIGSYMPVEGSTACFSCDYGTYNDELGKSTCKKCPAGKFSYVQGQTACVDCPPGSYSQAGQSACSKCDGRTISRVYGASSCTSCDPNAVTDILHTRCLCSAGYAAKQVPADSPEATNMNILNTTSINGTSTAMVEICVQCPVGAVCDIPGSTWGNLAVESGYWSSDNTNFYRCMMNTHCPGGAATDGLCASNRGGPLCAMCLAGYSETVGGICQKCSGSVSIVFFVIIIAIVASILIGMYVVILRSGSDMMEAAAREDATKQDRVRRSSSVSERPDGFGNDDVGLDYDSNRYGEHISWHGPPSPRPNFTYKMKIALSFIQIVTNVAIGLETPWPATFKTFIGWFNPANLDFVQLSAVKCVVTSTYYTKLWTFCIIPVILITGVLIFVLLPGYIMNSSRTPEGRTARKIIRKKTWKLVLFTLFLVYPSVSSFVLRLYICKYVDGVAYLVADFAITCYDSTYNFHAKLDIITVILYPVGVPLFIYAMIHRYRNRLDEVGIRAELGFLYDAYDRQFFYWELLDMVHKLTLVSLIAFLPYNLQMPGGIVVIGLYTIALLVCKPYIRKGDDKLHLISQVEMLCLLIAGHVFQTDFAKYDKNMDIIMSVILIIAFLSFILYFLLQCAQALRKLWKDRFRNNVKRSQGNLEAAAESEMTGVQSRRSFAVTAPEMNNPVFDNETADNEFDSGSVKSNGKSRLMRKPSDVS